MTDNPAIVIGVMGTSLTDRGVWSAYLPKILSPVIEREVTVQIHSKPGATSRCGLLIVEQIIRFPPNVVIVEYAINDAAMHRRICLKESENNIVSIIRRLRSATTNTGIYLMTTNPTWGIRGLVRPRLQTYYECYAKIACQHSVRLIDNRADWNTLSRNQLIRAVPDGTHPVDKFSLSITLKNIVGVLASDINQTRSSLRVPANIPSF